MSQAKSQFGRAITAANLTEESGLYVIRPRWAGQKMLLKFGLTKNITTRVYAGYRHSFPYAAPGNSFELVAFLRVGEDFLRARETTMLRATIGGYGFNKPANDLEWRTFSGDDRALMHASLIKLFRDIRTTIDGNFFIFHPTTGEIIYKGGRSPQLNTQNILQAVPNVLTRSMEKAGLRRTQTGLLVMKNGQMVPNVVGAARRLRNKPQK